MGRLFSVLTDSSGWGVPMSIDKALAIVDKAIIRGEGPFQRRKNHQDDGIPRKRLRALLGLRWSLGQGRIGDTFGMRDGNGVRQVLVREVEKAVNVIDTSGNVKADVYWTYVKQVWPKALFLGAYVCKFIVGTNEHSQHSYGNAVDFSLPTQAAMELAAKDIVARADKLNIERVIVGDRGWQRGVGWFHYSGDYHYHVHVDFTPNFPSTLPCGVRN